MTPRLFRQGSIQDCRSRGPHQLTKAQSGKVNAARDERVARCAEIHIHGAVCFEIAIIVHAKVSVTRRLSSPWAPGIPSPWQCLTITFEVLIFLECLVTKAAAQTLSGSLALILCLSRKTKTLTHCTLNRIHNIELLQQKFQLISRFRRDSYFMMQLTVHCCAFAQGTK